jgi:hypothetical protein
MMKRFNINNKKFQLLLGNTEPINAQPLVEWCRINIGNTFLRNESEVHDGLGKWSFCPWAGGRYYTFFFINNNDAMRFKLRWCDEIDG